jgi:hypothetical protein
MQRHTYTHRCITGHIICINVYIYFKKNIYTYTSGEKICMQLCVCVGMAMDGGRERERCMCVCLHVFHCSTICQSSLILSHPIKSNLSNPIYSSISLSIDRVDQSIDWSWSIDRSILLILLLLLIQSILPALFVVSISLSIAYVILKYINIQYIWSLSYRSYTIFIYRPVCACTLARKVALLLAWLSGYRHGCYRHSCNRHGCHVMAAEWHWFYMVFV